MNTIVSGGLVSRIPFINCRFHKELNHTSKNRLFKSGKGRALYTLTAILMLISTVSAGNHLLSAGPRFGYFNEKTRVLSKYFLGVSVGYRYSFDARNIFRISAELESSLDFQSNLDGKWREPWLDMFLEPGIGFLFIRLLPFTFRLSTGFSYRFTRLESTGSIQVSEVNPDGIFSSTQILFPYTSNTHKYGIFLNPGLFLMGDRGHIGLIMLTRFFSGTTKYDYDDPPESLYLESEVELSETMADVGIEGGFITGRFSHSLSFLMFRFSKDKIKGRPDRDQVSDWKGGPGNILLSYRLGIPIPFNSGAL